MAITLGRKAFLRELVVAALLSLTLPMVSVAGVYFYIHISAMNPIGLALGVIVVSGLTAIPLIFYASLRLNAATLARERASAGVPEQLIHKPLEGPFLLRRSIVAGSVQSRIIAGFPVCIGFGIEFALMAYLTNSIGFLLLHVPIGATLAAQIIIAANLLR
ncbi:hypothetical protein [Sulfitobacter sp. CW3]|uniref:hypothetical protein n=1 Tax=Sulfitobacter sp. CW3 TaxID=2861965 RepID=UPI001C5FF6C6|nr:hypothetical protein [Sulfitobacter sp. CW3]MBW4960968.1 hypothetical protein [Sulfitobacter sp. CW3]